MVKLTILVCGTGAPAHVLAGLAASRENMDARVFSLMGDEAETWSDSLKKEELTLTINEGEDEPTVIKSKPRVVTNDPGRAVKGANVIILTVPPNEQQMYLEAIVPHLEADTTIVGFPGYAGFELLCFSYLKTKAKKCAVVNIESMPYACRVKEFGKNVAVLGIIDITRGTMIIGKCKAPYDPLAVLQKILGKFPVLERYSNYLEPLLATNTVVNPAIMYGKWKNWDGKPLDEKPLFYQGISEQDAKCISALSEECVEIAKAITAKKPKIELDWVIPLYELFLEEYHANIGDPTSLHTLIKTNSAYDGIYHPMTTTEDDKFLPDFNCRYLSEDVPRGIVISKGIALLVGVKTPIHNSVIEWCQEKMGKEFIVGRDLRGKDLVETRCPQIFGFESLDDLVNIL